ncbi:MAG: hypothetical protein ACRD4G_12060 [Bryobacteraceae bacterium]
MSRTLELIFTPTGSVELVDSADRILWASDDDDDFAEKNQNEILGEDDAESILEYLVSEHIITSTEADDVDIFSESDDDTESDDAAGDNIIDADFEET